MSKIWIVALREFLETVRTRAFLFGVIIMPGFIMAAVAFLEAHPKPTRGELAQGLSGNLCRCQDYDKILTAMMRGAENMRRASRA